MTDSELDSALRACAKLEPGAEWLAPARALLEKEKRRKLRARWIRGGAAIALLASAAFAGAFRDNSLSQIELRDANLRVNIDTRVSTVKAKLRWFWMKSGVLNLNVKWTSRYVCDPQTSTVRGYEFHTKSLPQGRYRFNFRVLTQDPRPGLPIRFQSYRWVGVESIPPPIEVAGGEKVEVELAREAKGKLYDELRVVPEQ